MFASRLLRLVGRSQQHFVDRDMTGLGDDELDRALVQAYFIAAPTSPSWTGCSWSTQTPNNPASARPGRAATLAHRPSRATIDEGASPLVGGLPQFKSGSSGVPDVSEAPHAGRLDNFVLRVDTCVV